MIFDTHAHYNSNQFKKDLNPLLTDMPNRGVGLIMCPGCDLESSKECIEIADKYDFIYAAVGYHPSDVKGVSVQQLEEIEALSHHPKVKAIGEIGLDYYWEKDPEQQAHQRVMFQAQLDMARSRNLPVIIHDRDAHKDCLDIVKANKDLHGVYHCYSGDVEDAKTLVKMGWMLSFTGVITFKNARKAVDVVEWLPLEHLMLETDAPYMAPEPYRGKRCDSTMIAEMAEKIAEIKGITPVEVIRITTENGKRFFGID